MASEQEEFQEFQKRVREELSEFEKTAMLAKLIELKELRERQEERLRRKHATGPHPCFIAYMCVLAAALLAAGVKMTLESRYRGGATQQKDQREMRRRRLLRSLEGHAHAHTGRADTRGRNIPDRAGRRADQLRLGAA